jgi:predicted nucleotidyltransferase component of viral defense system
MIGRPELSRLAAGAGVSERAQEKDYVLAWLLAARARLGPDTLVFKGGTALRRCWFAGYRYSEDLDFTADDRATDAAIWADIDAWCEWVGDEAGITATRLVGTKRHRGTAFVAYVGPLRAAGGRTIKIDVARDETVRNGSEDRPLLSEYSDLDGAAFQIDAYGLDEIWAEKVRSLLQRSEPRDLYDLHRLLAHDASLAMRARALFHDKAIAKGLDPEGLLERLTRRETTWDRLWRGRLEAQVRDLPEFDGVWRRVIAGLRRAGY